MDSPLIEHYHDHNLELLEMIPHEYNISEESRNRRGMGPLHVATSEGREEVVMVLLQHGADVQSADNLGNTALHYCGHKEIAANLIEYGADPIARNRRGDTPLDLMRRRGVESQVLTYMTEVVHDIEHTTEDASDPLLPKTRKFFKRPSVKYVKSICTEFFAELGLKRLIILLFIVLVLSLYFAFVITGFSKQRELRIPVDEEVHKIEL